jgi:nucleoid-associated protein YgaU
MFDTTETGDDLRRITNPLWKLTMVNDANKNPKTKKGEPPRCEFIWGNVWSFEAVVTNINQNFTMFLEDGTPVRSTVDLTLKQTKDIRDFPGTNPTSGGVPGQRTRVVKQGETLDLIAAEEYGDSNHWRFIAEQNNIQHPLRVKPGRVLSLPPLPG